MISARLDGSADDAIDVGVVGKLMEAAKGRFGVVGAEVAAIDSAI